MNPVIIAAGIYLSTRIVSFIAGELTESELKKQKEIDDEISRIRTNCEETKQAEDIDNPTKPILKKRIIGRRICKKCGAIYNIYFDDFMPKVEGVCDKCGGELYQRDDDNEESMNTRIKTYFEVTEPIIDYYKEKGVLKTIDASQDNDIVLKELGWTPIHFWEKEVKKDLQYCVHRVIDEIQMQFSRTVEL